jgi:hypothetical protein
MQRDATVDPTTFSLRPEHKRKFRPQQVKSAVRQILVAKLEGQEYNGDNMQTVIKEIADAVRDKVRDMDFRGYKILVHCVVGEQRGEGVRMGCKCFWDSDTDNYAEEMYITKQLFGVVTVYGLYQY